MSVDISDAIINLVSIRQTNLTRMQGHSKNRVNSEGVGLEEYVKDLFANTFSCRMGQVRQKRLRTVFSYLGAKNHPPDIMLRGGGAAIEVKKEEDYGDIQFNSSHPRSILCSTDSKILDGARTCETWQQRDMLYVVGIVQEKTIKKLCMFYGTEFFADNSIYLGLEQRIRDAVQDDTVDTNELGRCNDIDPLHISSLRIRGMWLVKNPFVHFREQFSIDNSKQFTFVVLVENNKYNHLNRKTELETLQGNVPGFSIQDVNVPDPNNAAQEIACKLIKFEM